MGNEDTTDRALDDRRQLVSELRAHDDVRRLTFTRDGFRTVLVELEPGAEFREEWRRTATRLGYTVEHLEVDDSPPGWSENAWALRLSRRGLSTWTDRARRIVARARAVVERLLDR